MTAIPVDENAAVLRRMREGGDTLTKPRMVDFSFVFPKRSQSLAFAAGVGEREFEVCLSYYEQREMWQAIVRIHMIPDHSEISRIEADLAVRATAAGGEADGWGCIRVVD